MADSRSAEVDGGPCHLLGKDLLLRNRFAAALITHAFTKLLARIYPTTVRGSVCHKTQRPRLTSAHLFQAGSSEGFDAKRVWPPIRKTVSSSALSVKTRVYGVTIVLLVDVQSMIALADIQEMCQRSFSALNLNEIQNNARKTIYIEQIGIVYV